MTSKYLTRTIKMTMVAVFTFQLLSTVERQVFDFLGFMWAPIIGNFFQIIAVILGLFGACQQYRSFVIVYAVWSLLWLGWNIFVICLYLEVGILNRNRERYILTIGTESKSWWLEHGIGCFITNNSWRIGASSSDASRFIPPEEYVDGCILQYYYVEVIHAAVQCLLSLIGFVVACVTIYTYLEDEDSSSNANDELEFVKIRRRAVNNTTTIAAATAAANHSAPTTSTSNNFDNLAFDSDSYHDDDRGAIRRAYPPPPGPRPYEQPPSYDTTMRNTNLEAETRAANMYYASDRQSTRSKASTRSKRSTTHQRAGNQASQGRSRNRDRERDRARHDLPWVQITPSASGSGDGMFRYNP